MSSLIGNRTGPFVGAPDKSSSRIRLKTIWVYLNATLNESNAVNVSHVDLMCMYVCEI